MLRMLLVVAMAIAAQGVAAQSSVKWTPLNASSRQQSEQRAPGPAPVTPTVTTKAVPSTEDSAAAAIPENLALLRGKKVMVGRIALCVPNSFQPNLAYAGKIATVVGFKAVGRKPHVVELLAIAVEYGYDVAELVEAGQRRLAFQYPLHSGV